MSNAQAGGFSSRMEDEKEVDYERDQSHLEKWADSAGGAGGLARRQRAGCGADDGDRREDWVGGSRVARRCRVAGGLGRLAANHRTVSAQRRGTRGVRAVSRGVSPR